MNSKFLLTLAIVFSGIACLFAQLAIAQTRSEYAYLDLTVPRDAVVYINGVRTKGEGGHRKYVSKHQLPGHRYRYEILAVVERNGRQLQQQAEVELSRGESKAVSLLLERVAEDPVTHTALKPQASRPPAANKPRVAPPQPPVRPVSHTEPLAGDYLPLPSIPPSITGHGRYFAVPLDELKITSGRLPTPASNSTQPSRQNRMMLPYAVLDGTGEAYVDLNARTNAGGRRGMVVARTEANHAPSGWLFLPDAGDKPMVRLRFTMDNRGSDRETFYRVKLSHYRRLRDLGIPGAAWFRHQARDAAARLQGGPGVKLAPAPVARAMADTKLMDWYAMLTSGRAISENLSLDQRLTETRDGQSTVPISSLPGITVRSFDWKSLTRNLHPQVDPLASYVPADQHAVFFRSVADGIKLGKHAGEKETVILRLLQPRSENHRTGQRYERQMCVSLDRMEQLLKPSLVQSVALTGSDIHASMGTDVAVLFESPRPAMLAELLREEIASVAKRHAEARFVHGEIGGLPYHGVQSPDRRVSSYVASVDDFVVLTNSMYQLRRIADVRSAREPSLGGSREYIYFRDRYPIGDAEETGLVVISDAAIRRWCGPRWRIGQARRIRNAAVLSEAQAIYVDSSLNSPLAGLPRGMFPDFVAGTGGIYSPLHGSLDFMTPVAELPLDRVTPAEASAYRRWRTAYQRKWTVAFDPIAMRLGVGDDGVSADVTVMPLTVRSSYSQLRSIVQGASISLPDGESPDALARITLAVNKKSEPMRSYLMFAAMALREQRDTIGDDPLGWFGGTVTVYVDDDPFWKEFPAISEDERSRMLKSPQVRPLVLLQMPVGIELEVTSGLKLAKFLSGLRAFLEQTIPGMLTWESRTYRDEPYTKVSLREALKFEISQEIRDALQGLDSPSIYYTASGTALTIAFRESVLQRAIDRRIGRPRGHQEPVGQRSTEEQTVRGENVTVHVEQHCLTLLSQITGDYRELMQQRSWANLPILNEWKRLFPNKDPIGLHESLWQTKLLCPGGGAYVWNDHWKTFESTVYGHPGSPMRGPSLPVHAKSIRSADFGLTFENESLRAKVFLRNDPYSAPDRGKPDTPAVGPTIGQPVR